MSWLNDLDTDSALHALADECCEHLVESYYLIFEDQQYEEGCLAD